MHLAIDSSMMRARVCFGAKAASADNGIVRFCCANATPTTTETPKKAANACLFCFTAPHGAYQIVPRIWSQSDFRVLGATRPDCLKEEMGIVMKKLVLAAAVLAVTAGSALAADMAVKAKAPPPAPFDPWDFAFGAAIMNDYIFRGVTQSNHKPSVAVYFEPRYNVTKDLQPMSASPARASRSRTAPRPKSTSTPVSARPSACSPSTSAPGATSIRVGSASIRPRSPARAFRAPKSIACLNGACRSTATSPRRTPASTKSTAR